MQSAPPESSGPPIGSRAAKRLSGRGLVLRTLRALMDAGPRGITIADVSSCAYRLSVYVRALRARGVQIVTERSRTGRAIGRYILPSKVEFVA